MTETNRKRKSIIWILALVTLCGLALRAASCFWGYPMALHPDELTIVDNAIDMLRRHSWLAYVYNRPDQFEIKCNAALFAIASRILFKVPAYEAFETHYMAFYVIARGFTTVFGTAMIPLAAMLAGRMVRDGKQRRLTEIATAFIFAFSPILVEHSAYATPDIVLTFFVLLFAVQAQYFLESGKAKYLWLCVLTTGIAVTIKYPAAILCVLIAAMVIYRCVRDRKYGRMIGYGILSILLLLAVMFVIAPNLFLDFKNVYETLMFEARPNHLGADGLGWFGNLVYYLKTAVADLEPLSVVFALIGILWAIRNHSARTAAILIGPVYLIFISIPSLHWIQWGIPGYVFYNLLAALGTAALLCRISETDRPKTRKRLATMAAAIFAGVLGLNLCLTSTAETKNRLVEDTRSVSLRYCVENGINTGNALFEGFTPLSPNGAAGYRYYAFHLDDGKACVNEPYAVKQYFIMSGSYSGRFLAESDRYPDEAAIYQAIPESFREIYRAEGAGGYSRATYALRNIPNTLRFFGKHYDCTGAAILIYDLDPERVSVASAEDEGTMLALEDGAVILSRTPQNWVIYRRDNGSIVFLCAENNQALGHDDSGRLILVPPESENECEFECTQRNGSIVLTSNGSVLTREKDTVVFRSAGPENAAQEWKLISAES